MVELGVHSIKNGALQKIKVQKKIPHPCYDSQNKVNDLMLLKVMWHHNNQLPEPWSDFLKKHILCYLFELNIF